MAAPQRASGRRRATDRRRHRGQLHGAHVSGCSRGMSDAAPAIETHELTRRFGSFVAVDRITFNVRAGEVFGFLGANGAGKTTAIRILIGLLAPSGGEARVAGFNVRTQQKSI